MKYIFDHSNLKVLENLASVDTLYAFDFDGTLSPIVTDYRDAKTSAIINDLMMKLCALVPVAIISGRSVTDLKRILNFSPKYLIGNHGLEGVLSEMEVEAIKTKCNECKKIIVDFGSVIFGDIGIVLEDKIFSFSLHYRNAADPEKAEKIIHEAIKLLPIEAEIIKGKSVINVLPSLEINKGYAFRKILLLENKQYSFFIGDDETDEDIFDIADPNCLTVRVERSPKSKAKFYINNQSEIEILLTKILNYMETKNLIIQ